MKQRVAGLLGNEEDLLRIWDYVETNPVKRREDCYFAETEV